ncbi:prephenate dehydrogenase (NADP(+)) [Ranunculus cassubicifolius]
MASSSNLCNSKSNLYQIQSEFPLIAASVKTPQNMRSSKSKSIGMRSHTHISTHLDTPSTSSSSTYKQEKFPLKIGIIGLGAFGQFLAKAFQRQGHHVLGTSRSDYSEYCQQNGIEFFKQLNGLCDAKPDVVLICSSIVSTEDVVKGIPFHKLKPDTIIADVLSVKEFPKNVLLNIVPEGFGILCTHPMFGKFSGKNNWEGLRFVYDKVRITENSIQEKKCEQFLSIFGDEGCRMVEMTCEEHDRYAAESQFVTHTVARILSNMNMEATPIDTKGYETLMELTQNTVSHGSDLYDGLFLYNVNSVKQIKKLEKAFDTVKTNLFEKLRESFKRQINDDSESVEEKVVEPVKPSRFLPVSEKEVKDVSSFSMAPGLKKVAVERKLVKEGKNNGLGRTQDRSLV